MRKTRKLIRLWEEYQQAKEDTFQKREEYVKEYLKCNSRKVSVYTEQEWDELATIANGVAFSELTTTDDGFCPTKIMEVE